MTLTVKNVGQHSC